MDLGEAIRLENMNDPDSQQTSATGRSTFTHYSRGLMSFRSAVLRCVDRAMTPRKGKFRSRGSGEGTRVKYLTISNFIDHRTLSTYVHD